MPLIDANGFSLSIYFSITNGRFPNAAARHWCATSPSRWSATRLASAASLPKAKTVAPNLSVSPTTAKLLSSSASLALVACTKSEFTSNISVYYDVTYNTRCYLFVAIKSASSQTDFLLCQLIASPLFLSRLTGVAYYRYMCLPLVSSEPFNVISF